MAIRLDRALREQRSPSVLLPWSWIAALTWVVLIVGPYLMLAGLAGAADDPGWLDRRCFGLSHITNLSIVNGALVAFLGLEGGLALRRGGARLRLAGHGLVLALLLTSQVALVQWRTITAWVAGA